MSILVYPFNGSASIDLTWPNIKKKFLSDPKLISNMLTLSNDLESIPYRNIERARETYD